MIKAAVKERSTIAKMSNGSSSSEPVSQSSVLSSLPIEPPARKAGRLQPRSSSGESGSENDYSEEDAVVQAELMDQQQKRIDIAERRFRMENEVAEEKLKLVAFQEKNTKKKCGESVQQKQVVVIALKRFTSF